MSKVVLQFLARYRTPNGLADLLMSSDGEVLTGLWFEGSADEAKHRGDFVARDLPIFRETADWLDSYFAGRPSAKLPRHRVVGSDGSLVGYGGGLSNKAALLAHEAKFAISKEDESNSI